MKIDQRSNGYLLIGLLLKGIQVNSYTLPHSSFLYILNSMQGLVDYGSDEEEEPTPSFVPPQIHPSSFSAPSPIPPPQQYQSEVQQLIQQEEERDIDRDGGRSPYTEGIINKLTEEMDHVVSVHSWSPHSSLHSPSGGRGMDRIRCALNI